tara:strand:+ start:37945 stop:38385 length:441 start_codon:yes stop_codon:yes gene_type:complete
MPCLVWLLVVVIGSYCCIASANVDQKSSSAGKLVKLFPQAMDFAPLANQLEVKERIEDRLEIIGRRKNNHPGNTFARSSKIKQYIKIIKSYSELKLTDKLAVTIGSVKAGPLGVQDLQLIDTREVFHSKHDIDDSKGYGLKFKFNL